MTSREPLSGNHLHKATPLDRSNKVSKHEKHLAARTREFSHGKVSLSADGKHRNASVATSQRWTNRQNPESRQNLIPLISRPTSQTRKQPDKPHLLGPDPTQPQSQGQAMQHTPLTADSKQEGGLWLSHKKKLSAGTRGLARVNSAAFYTVNTRQTLAKRCHRDYREDLRHLGI